MNEDILFYAFRYALGRMTYAVSTVVDELVKHWPDASYHFKELVVHEINKAIFHSKAGMSIDIAEWSRVLELEK